MILENKPFLIGETAFHHEGNPNFLDQLVEAGINAGVNTLKFHLLFDLDDYVIKDHAAYAKLEELILPKSYWNELHTKLVKQNIKPIYLCNDVEALKWVNALNHKEITAIEIHATGINDFFLLEEATSFKGQVMLGSGGSSIDQVNTAIDYLRDNNKHDIILMHGFQNYPTDYNDINFSKMNMLRDLFKLPVGYADHTDPKDPLNASISCLPQSMGFHILEKHFTHKPEEDRIDGQSAVSIDQLKQIKQQMDIFYATHGSNPTAISKAELKYGNVGPMKKAIVARRKIAEGEIIQKESLAYKRTNASVPLGQDEIFNLIGNKATKAINIDEIIDYNNVAYNFEVSDTSQFKLKK